MRNRRFHFRLDRRSIRFVHSLFLNHGDEFSAACHNGWDGGEEAQGEERVGGEGEVVGTQEGVLEGGGEGGAGGVENVEGVGEEEEGDGEVDCCGVDWFAHCFLVFLGGMRLVVSGFLFRWCGGEYTLG